MWIPKHVYRELEDAHARAREAFVAANIVREVLERHNAALTTTVDWFRVRISQLEMERAQLLFNYTGVKVATPSIERVPDPVEGHPLNQTVHFGDVGDREAAKLGIRWNQDGTLKYDRPYDLTEATV